MLKHTCAGETMRGCMHEQTLHRIGTGIGAKHTSRKWCPPQGFLAAGLACAGMMPPLASEKGHSADSSRPEPCVLKAGVCHAH